MELSSTLSIHYPKPGKPVVKPASVLEDLRGRDFTANAMALSLNEGSYGLLMDPLNGVADIENRELRLVSNYGFIEDPIRMVRAQRLAARLGWQLEERTQSRYDTGRDEGYISALSEFQRGYELEEIAHEEDPLRVLRRLEAEGWMKVLYPAWTIAKVNTAELDKLRDTQAHLQMQGVSADASAAQFPLLTAKLSPKEISSLKESFPRPGFVAEIDALEAEGKQFAAELSSRQAATPSAAWKLITGAPPEVVLWVAYSTRSASLQAKFKSFYNEWPGARQRIPYVTMQEMRITSDLPIYNELLEKLFFELMDGKLSTPEELKAFLEPYSPPAPPPPVNLRRARGTKPKASKAKKVVEPEEPLDDEPADLIADSMGGDELSDAIGQEAEEDEEEEETMPEKPARSAAPRPISARPVKTVPAKVVSVKTPAPPAPAKAAKVVAKAAPVPAAPAKVSSSAKAVPAKAAKPAAAPAKKAAPARPVARKAAAKLPAKPISRPSPAVQKGLSAAARKPAAKAVPAKKSVPGKQGNAAKASPKPAKVAAKKIAVKKPLKAAPAKSTKVVAKSSAKAAKKTVKAATRRR
jgi:hypothetical protein